jgi:hypothetical protein
MQSIKKANSISELNKIKENFLSECAKQEKIILVNEMFNSINDFVTAKTIFESLASNLLYEKGGKRLINNYTKIIKENKSLKTLYSYNEGLNKHNTSDSKKEYINEALSIGEYINPSEYENGLKEILKIISESFKILGEDFVLDNMKINKKTKLIGESLRYITSTKKTLKNLNEYMSHVDILSETINENIDNEIDANQSLEEVVSNIKKTTFTENIDNIFNTNDKESEFKETKKKCMEMISKQKNSSKDIEIISELNKMEEKLDKKHYTFETFTKDMLYMTELQEVLK